MSGGIFGIFGCHNWCGGRGCYWQLSGYRPGFAVKHPTKHRLTPTTKNCWTPNVSSADVEKPCSEGRKAILWKVCWVLGVPRLRRWRDSPNLRTSHLKLGRHIAEKFSLSVTPAPVMPAPAFHPDYCAAEMDQRILPKHRTRTP